MDIVSLNTRHPESSKLRNSINLSVIIITYNEQDRILACLKNLPKCDEIIVLDSFSDDKTKELATNFGCKVFERSFENYADQKNAALSLSQGTWVLSVDADEILTPELRVEIEDIVKKSQDSKPSVQAYKIPRRLIFLGKQLYFGKTSDQPVRLFRREKSAFVHKIHEQVKVEGKVGKLKGILLHYSFNDLSDYFKRFNSYTSKIAQNHLQNKKKFNCSPMHIFRPWVDFFYRYVIRLGFLDGYPGYCYALISSLYAFIKYAKLIELKQKEKLIK